VFPVEAATEIAGMRVFHDDVTGGYLIYARWPGTEVLVDDRAELYRDEYVAYREVRTGERAWEPYFASRGLEGALLRAGSRLGDELAAAGWEAVYADGRFVVWLPPG
jgi:hypothetical protein